jgi:hypothetical protein
LSTIFGEEMNIELLKEKIEKVEELKDNLKNQELE